MMGALDRSPQTTQRWAVPGAVLIFVSAFLVYLNSLPNGFTLDDLPVIVDNPATDPSLPWWEPASGLFCWATVRAARCAIQSGGGAGELREPIRSCAVV